ncbi:DNA-binding protein [Flavipsychrobacter stenotrophus]|uniref:DNA-binding protein n=1 Tax=Flavipsychrobacter stenotrophus TaxID=2077091 RepID=A0A2S7SRX5_9BACT|nr:helix-turn-helix domain-containing protein [Flavipsychrobacter stenotrophus]PQJ09381.1 DNA-binding protein [Flavipsychrobacter stenotrophus]
MENNSDAFQELQLINGRLTSIEQALLSVKAVLTFDEVAAYTGLSKSYLYKLTAAGLVPHSKPMGKQIYFDREEVDHWLLRNEVKTADKTEAEATAIVTLKKYKKTDRK